MNDAPVILVCARLDGELLMPDNLVGRCYECRHQVQFRPHAPANRVLRCTECALDMLTPDDTVITTPKMLEDVKIYFRKRMH